MSYRVDQLERRVENITRALWTNAATILVGVIVFLITRNLDGS